MLTSSSILLVVCPLLLLALFLAKREEPFAPSQRSAVLMAYLVPAIVLVLYSLIWRLDATRILLTLRAVAFRSSNGVPLEKTVSEAEPGRGRIVVGDAPKATDPSRPRLLGTLLFRPKPGGVGSLSVQLPPPEARGGVITTTEDGILGSVPLENGDRICVGSTCWTYDERARSFTSDTSSVTIAPRRTKIPGTDHSFTLPWAPPIGARVRTYSLDWLASRGAAPSPGERIRSFVAYDEPDRRLRLIPLDKNVSLMRKGRRVAAGELVALKPGTRLTFFSLPIAGDSFEAPGIGERRSVVFLPAALSYALQLDTPEVRSLTVEEFRSLALGTEEERQKQLAVNLSMGDAQITDRSLYLSGLSDSVALQAASLLEFAPSFPRNLDSHFRLISPRGPADAALGDSLWVGTIDLASIRFDVVRPPLLLLLFGVLLALLKSAAALRSGSTLHQVVLAGAVECLVGMRLLVSYRVWAMPPHLTEALDIGLIAWVTLPWLLLGASMKFQRREYDTFSLKEAVESPWMITAAGLLLSLVFTVRLLEGRLLLAWTGAHVLAVGVAVIRHPALTHRFAEMGRDFRAMFGCIRWPRWLVQLIQPLREQKLLGVLLSAAAICGARIVLLLGGSKEALIGTGGRISLSAMHIPAAAIVEGIFFFRAWQRVKWKGISWLHLGVAFALLLLLWGIPGVATSDLGLMLLNVPVFAGMLVAMHRRADRDLEQTHKWDRLRRVSVWAPATAVLLTVFLAPLGRFVLPLVASEDTMLALASDANYARFLHFAEPERLRELATKRGESLAITSAILQSYIDSGIFGRGYGATEVSPLLGSTAVRDFAPAVFVAAEWGLTGTVTLLVVYALFLLLGMQAATWVDDASGAAGAVETVAGSTIATSSIYMVLANHELLLLTGKNAYLFGLDSAGDLVEFLFLLLLMAYGAATRRENAAEGERSTFGGWR